MKFPYGIADFQTLREEQYFYVDRTDRIARVEAAGKQLLFLRPRRFGKSLWLSTLENYYDLAKADAFDSLFADLKIGRKPTPKRNSYFVLKLNFSGIDCHGDSNAIAQALHTHINSCIYGFGLHYKDYLPQPIECVEYDSFASLRNLLSLVASSSHKLYLLIDEYDNFANEVMISQTQGKHHYHHLVAGEGALKTFFKVVKEAAEGRGLDRVFITGVSPVVMSDISSGYNVVENIFYRPEYHDLCGFTTQEVRQATAQTVSQCGLPTEKIDDALTMMRTFYNGYQFAESHAGQIISAKIYNPTLCLYFLKALAQDGVYPQKILDENLAMDRNRIEYVAQLPHGQTLITQALAANQYNLEQTIKIDQLADRFGVQIMLSQPKDHAFLTSLLYYLGVLTLDGRDEWGQLRLTIPNLVVRKLYVERLQEALLPDYNDQEQRQAAARQFYMNGNLTPLSDFIEQTFFKVFDNRDLRWSNELTVKTAFLTLLFNDTFYIMDSETSIDRGYADLSLILRPDTRHYKLLDHLLEFKYLKWDALKTGSANAKTMPREELRQLPAVKAKLTEAEAQLRNYRETLERVYGDLLRLQTHAVVCIGLERLVWSHENQLDA